MNSELIWEDEDLYDNQYTILYNYNHDEYLQHNMIVPTYSSSLEEVINIENEVASTKDLNIADYNTECSSIIDPTVLSEVMNEVDVYTTPSTKTSHEIYNVYQADPSSNIKEMHRSAKRKLSTTLNSISMLMEKAEIDKEQVRVSKRSRTQSVRYIEIM